MENHLRYLEVTWAAQRSGLYYTAINWHLNPDEIAYVIGDSGARVLIRTTARGDKLRHLLSRMRAVGPILCLDGTRPGALPYEQGGQGQGERPDSALTEPAEGCELLYS